MSKDCNIDVLFSGRKKVEVEKIVLKNVFIFSPILKIFASAFFIRSITLKTNERKMSLVINAEGLENYCTPKELVLTLTNNGLFTSAINNCILFCLSNLCKREQLDAF